MLVLIYKSGGLLHKTRIMNEAAMSLILDELNPELAAINQGRVSGAPDTMVRGKVTWLQ